MSPDRVSTPLIAADVGNERIKLGLFESVVSEGLPEPCRTLGLNGAGQT